MLTSLPTVPTSSDCDVQGRKEVGEAVLQAAAIALFTGLANWAVQAAKDAVEERRKKRKARESRENPPSSPNA